MAKTPNEYTRMAGRGFRRQGVGIITFSWAPCSLWMGRDHLLLVEHRGYYESYKRFYFTDIQAIIIRPTSSAKVLTLMFSVIALLFFLWGLDIAGFGGRLALWIIAGFFALLGLVNFARGPSCVTSLQTAVQTEQLPSWGRMRAARKGMEQLRPRLREAQGSTPAEELKAQWLAVLRAPAAAS